MGQTRRALLGLAVAGLLSAGGCQRWSIPAVQQGHRAGWVVVDWELDVMDLHSARLYTLAPHIAALLHPADGDPIDGYSLSSGFTYAACSTEKGEARVVEVRSGRVHLLGQPRSDEEFMVSLMAWSPDERRLLSVGLARKSSTEDRAGLFICTTGDWTWTPVSAVPVQSERDYDAALRISQDAWESEEAFLFARDGRVWRYHLDSGVLEDLSPGQHVHSLGPGGFVCQAGRGADARIILHQQDAGGGWTETAIRRGTLGSAPTVLAVSPDRRHLLLRDSHVVQLSVFYPVAAIATDLVVYDLDRQKFSTVLRGKYHLPKILEIGPGQWLAVPDEMRRHLQRKKARAL